MTVRAAVIGAGPSGFYAADQLLKASVAVDLFDALPTPYGLVRAGVAPDHPKIKSVTRMYERTAQHPGVPLLRRRRARGRRHAGGAAGALPRARLRGRHADRQSARDPGRRPPGLGRRHRVRRLVQRPPARTRTRRSTSRATARWWSATATSRSTSRACSCWTPPSWRRPTPPTTRSRRSPPPP